MNDVSSKLLSRVSSFAVLTSLVLWSFVATAYPGSVQVRGELGDDHSETTQTIQARARLEPGHSIDQTLAPNETYGYETTLSAGQYFRLAVEPQDIDVVVTIFAPDGHQVLTKRSPYGAQSPVDACIVATSDGTYQAAVTATDNNAHSGRYQIRISELRKATPRDRNRAEAEELVAQAQEFQDKGTIESRRLAVDKYTQSLSVLRSAGDRLAQAQSLEQLGSLHNDLGNNKKAIELVKQSLQIFQLVRDRRGEGLATNDLGSIESDLGDNQEALAQLTMALVIRREVSDRRGEAETLEYIGDVYEGTSDTEKA